MPNRRPSIKPMNRTINIQQLKKSKHRRANMRNTHASASRHDDNRGWHGGGRTDGGADHAVSTCSPDCPTDSAVERALVDLEWRREAAGKRNGNTHRVNTQVPEEMRGCYHQGRASHEEMVLGMNGQEDWPPHCMVVAGLTQLLHTQAWQRHSSQCFILRTHWRTQTPGLDSHHEASTSHYGNKPHEVSIRRLSPGRTAKDGLLTQLTRCHWYVMHMPPCTKNKSERFIMFSQQEFMDHGGSTPASDQWKGLVFSAQLP